MPSNLPQFTVRPDRLTLKKFRYVADYHARSANKELELLMKKHVTAFESKYGEITEDLLKKH